MRSTIFRPKGWPFLCIMILLLLAGEVEGAEKARVQEAFVVNSQTDLLLYFRVDGAISPEMEKGILNGIPVTFSFFVELHEYQEQKGLVQVASRNFRHSLHFETLKEEFQLERTEHAKEMVRVKEFDKAVRAMVVVHDLPVASLAFLKPGSRYIVKMKARLAKEYLPEKFKNVMTFIKMWDFETKWHELGFTMAPALPAEEEGLPPSRSR
jgi:hypothetical protein